MAVTAIHWHCLSLSEVPVQTRCLGMAAARGRIGSAGDRGSLDGEGHCCPFHNLLDAKDPSCARAEQCALTALGSLQEGQPGGQSCCTLIPCTLMNSAPQLVFTC